MSKYISKYAPPQTVKIPNLEQYVAIFPKGTGTGPVPIRVRKIPDSIDTLNICMKKFDAIKSYFDKITSLFLT